VGIFSFSALLGLASAIAFDGTSIVGVVVLVLSTIVSIAVIFVPYIWFTVATFRRGNQWMGFGLIIALILTPLALGTACFAILSSLGG
jgi:hypothetical protein